MQCQLRCRRRLWHVAAVGLLPRDAPPRSSVRHVTVAAERTTAAAHNSVAGAAAAAAAAQSSSTDGIKKVVACGRGRDIAHPKIRAEIIRLTGKAEPVFLYLGGHSFELSAASVLG